MCVYHCAQLLYTTQHRTVLIIFPPVLQTIISALMISVGGNGVNIIIKHVHRPTTTLQRQPVVRTITSIRYAERGICLN